MRQCLTMSRNWYTPVTYWLNMPLLELRRWIEVSNKVIEESRK